MFGRQEIHVYHEEDGVIYDSDTADILHYWDTFLGGRRILAVTPGGDYFMTMLSAAAFTPRFYVIPINERYLLYLAAKRDAPDSTMEKLGVRMFAPVKSDEPYNFISSETVWAKKTWLGWNMLLRNYDGRFWMFKIIDIIGVRIKKALPMTQREAIAWAIDNNIRGDTMSLIGVEDGYR